MQSYYRRGLWLIPKKIEREYLKAHLKIVYKKNSPKMIDKAYFRLTQRKKILTKNNYFKSRSKNKLPKVNILCTAQPIVIMTEFQTINLQNKHLPNNDLQKSNLKTNHLWSSIEITSPILTHSSPRLFNLLTERSHRIIELVRINYLTN